MEVTLATKFDIGDDVFFRSYGEICSGIVCQVQANFVKTEEGVVSLGAIYRLKDKKGERCLEDFWEKRLFASKEELNSKA